jgi:hypothetical protein
MLVNIGVVVLPACLIKALRSVALSIEPSPCRFVFEWFPGFGWDCLAGAWLLRGGRHMVSAGLVLLAGKRLQLAEEFEIALTRHAGRTQVVLDYEDGNGGVLWNHNWPRHTGLGEYQSGRLPYGRT